MDHESNLRTEYSSTNDVYMHYDNFTWQVGSILIAAVFVVWGFIVNSEGANLCTSLLITLLIITVMSVWNLYSSHNRQLYLYKLHRLREIEVELGMKQHTRFDKLSPENIYTRYGPAGHKLNNFIYGISTFGSVLIVWSQFDAPLLIFILLPVPILVLKYCKNNEEKVMKHIKDLEN